MQRGKWFIYIVATATKMIDNSQTKLKLTSMGFGVFTLPLINMTLALNYAELEPKRECSYMVWARATKGGLDVSGYVGSVPVVVSTLLGDKPNDPHDGAFYGVPTATNGYAYERPGKDTGRILQSELICRDDSSYDNKTVYKNFAYSEIKYDNTGYYMVLVVDRSKPRVMYVKQSEFSRVVWPAGNHSTSDFWGWRPKRSNGSMRFHSGPDIGSGGYTEYTIANKDIPVYAIMDGVVDRVQRDRDARGHTVVLKHNISGFGTFYTLYQHLRDNGNNGRELPAQGTKFYAGETIAYMGASGNFADSPRPAHLHFELFRVTPYSSGSYIQSSNDISINPLREYCSPHDSRDSRIPNNAIWNQQPFFTNDYQGYYAFNPIFDWEETKLPLPDKYRVDEKFFKP